MNEKPQNAPGNGGQQPQERVGLAVIEMLGSVKFAVAVVVVIALVCVAGTLVPQGTAAAAFVQKHPAAASRMEFFARIGLTHVYSAWWFIGLLGVLASTVAMCSLRRFATMRRTTGFAQRRALGSMLTHLSILLILAGGVIRGVWGEKGSLDLNERQIKAEFQVENGSRPLPFALQLAKFEIETYDQSKAAAEVEKERGSAAQSDCCNQLLVQWPERKLTARFPITLEAEQTLAPEGEEPTPENAFRIKILKYVPDFVIDPTNKVVASRSEEPRNPAILVQVAGPNYKNNRWLFAKFPDFTMHTGETHPRGPSPLIMTYQNHGASKKPAAPAGPVKSFKSKLHVVEGGSVVQTRTVEVNRPFSHQGYTFYQSGYDPKNLSWTSLQVVRDPGVGVVYAGFALMISGLFIVFYLNPWLETRRKQL
ncbi:MAG: cytochrome c biogenesis protein ResB [Verrucomicrobiota bacterium]